MHETGDDWLELAPSLRACPLRLLLRSPAGGLLLGGAAQGGGVLALDLDGLPDAVDHARGIAVEVGVASHPHRLAVEHGFQVVRQRIGSGEWRVLDQHGDHGRPGLQRVGDLHPHEVARRVDASAPRRPDQRQHRVHVGKPGVDHVLEPRAGWDRVDVAEHVGVAEDADQLVVEAPGEVGVVGAAIRHEDAHSIVVPVESGGRAGCTQRRHIRTLDRA